MKTKIAIITFTTILLLAIELLLIAVEFYFVAAAVVICTLLVVHREMWSLIKTKKLPPFDERIRDNITRSIRNSFVFLVFAIAVLMVIAPQLADIFFPYTNTVTVEVNGVSSSQPDGYSYSYQYIEFDLFRNIAHFLGYLLLLGGAAYMLCYVYYDRLQQKIGVRGVKAIKIALVTSGVLIAVFTLCWLLMVGLGILLSG